MSEFTLVRHGQANSGATDEASYDRLSDVGRLQADWLGGYLSAGGQSFDRIIAGPLRRQQDTATIIASHFDLPISTDDRLVEIDYFGLSQSMKDTHDVPFPTDRESWLKHLTAVIAAWADGSIGSRTESFGDFEARIAGLLSDAEIAGGRAMLVTSSGVIGMALRQILSLETSSYARMLLQVHNSSVHRYVLEAGERYLQTFNGTPHLDHPDRVEHRTFV